MSIFQRRPSARMQAACIPSVAPA